MQAQIPYNTNMAKGVAPSTRHGGSIAFEVDDVDEMIKTLEGKGIAVKVKPFDTAVCRMAIISDTEGNALTLHKKHPNNP